MEIETPSAGPLPALLVLLPCLLLPFVAGCGPREDPSAATVRISGAVAAGTPEAARTGREILARGGNAADAAVAVSLALSVTEPGQSGLGGTAVVLLRPAGEAPVVLHAPRIAMPAGEAGGARRATPAVPALLPVLARLHQRHGSGRLTWEELVEPAIRLAEEGFPQRRLGHRTLVQEYLRILADSSMAALFLTEDRAIPGEGTTLTRPELAATLRRIAGAGASDLYEGELAARLLDWAAGEGLSLTASSLQAAARVREEEALRGTFGPWTVWVPPEPFAGETVLRALRFLETAPRPVRETEDILAYWTVEALAWAFTAGSDDLAAHLPTLPPLPVPATDSLAAAGSEGETTHFSILDGVGNAVALTQTLGGAFGAGAAAGDLGFVLGRAPAGAPESVPATDSATSAPGTSGAADGATGPAVDGATDDGPEPLWLAPALVSRGDSLELVLGSPGGARGVSAVVQVITAWTRAPHALGAAVRGQRVHVGPTPGTERGRAYLEGFLSDAADSVLYDTGGRWDAATRATIAARGFLPTEHDDGLYFDDVSPWFGGVNAVARIRGEWLGAADPRRDGAAEVLQTTASPGTALTPPAGTAGPPRRVR